MIVFIGQFSLVFWRKIAYPDFLGLIALIFVTSVILFIAQSQFFWELIFCMFCYSYTGIKIDGIVPKECALGYTVQQLTHAALEVISNDRIEKKVTLRRAPVHLDIFIFGDGASQLFWWTRCWKKNTNLLCWCIDLMQIRR